MYDYIKIPEIIDDVKFENLTLDLYEKVLKTVQKNGRSGQDQYGIDIYGYTKDDELIGIQCKVKSKADFDNKKFRTQFIKEVKQEIVKAQNFSSKLKLFIIMTTAPRDAYVQKEVIDLDNDIFRKNGFHIKINFWDDISYMLTEEIHKNTFKKYYNNLIIHEEVIGSVKAKILSLIVGVASRTSGFGLRDESLYQLILGYIPKLIRYPNGIEYYSNTYFLGCFQSRGIDTFPIKCYPSDLESVITDNMSIRDRYSITDWLNSIDIDEEIRNDTREYHFYWTHEQYKEYLDSVCDDDEI